MLHKRRLLPKQLSDLNSATKYEGRIIIQESDDKIANPAKTFVFLRFMNLRFLIICSGTKAMLLFGLGY
jgi:hypothetical protein